eukprot:Pgem_evm1s13499
MFDLSNNFQNLWLSAAHNNNLSQSNHKATTLFGLKLDTFLTCNIDDKINNGMSYNLRKNRLQSFFQISHINKPVVLVDFPDVDKTVSTYSINDTLLIEMILKQLENREDPCLWKKNSI